MARPIPPLDPDLLLRAYTIGVFPMADSRDAASVYWVEPKVRAILPLDGFHLSRSLRKTLLSERFAITADRAFADVVALCAESAADRPATWINAQIEQSMLTLHNRGAAHSIETWRDGELVGGLYGLALGGAFFGESMVSRATDASKVALAHLVARLRVGGFALLDCQFQTDHLASLGAVEISREDYLERLDAALGATDYAAGADGGVGGVGAGSASSVEGEVERRAPDFFALDAVPDEGATTVSGPTSGWRIVQALVQTS